MLSKVLSAREGERAQPMAFTPLPASQVLSLQGPKREPDTAVDDQEMQALRQRVRQLEAEVIAARQAGFEAGQQQARQEIAPVVERLNASIADTVALRPELRRRAERDVVQLALMIAKRVLHRELSVDENALTALARVAFDRLSRAESCKVIVHPQFASAIGSALPASQSARIRIETDPNCAPGSLVLHSESGVIDASVDTQLEEINRGLTDRLAKG